MNQTLIPWSILSSSVSVSSEAEGWNLTVFTNPDIPRTFTVNVAFVSPFSFPPVVHLGITGLDTDQRDSPRISLRAENITETGFEAIITTWATTRVYGVDFNWLAIGA